MANPRFEPLIEFVHSNERDSSARNWNGRSKIRDRHTPLCGEDVRGFYEAVISETTPHVPKTSSQQTKRTKICDSKAKQTNTVNRSVANCVSWEKSDDKCNVSDAHSVSNVQHMSVSSISRDSDMKMRRLELRLLHKSQEGDVRGVEQAATSGANINVKDLYGWTPLMCSAYAGHMGVVQTLLGLGADWGLCERKGRTARDLANKVGHGSIVKLIDDTIADFQSSDDGSSSNQRVTNEEGFFCEICKRHFSEGTERSHKTSTVHLFNCQLKPKKPSYLISESNVGYQMMLRSGWNADRGLGPREEGQKYPVKTVLKRNREGLGGEQKSTPRVTHFPPRDVRAVATVKPRGERRESLRSQSRRAIKRRERKDKEWERNLRRYMNSD
ncbi:G patch domain and ankyrin repeat-containing protein 1-like isoform X2 [Haliotis rufescens]|nr:G patch domain and ankyrin repeat-containing protein 1-like isoform X2 [Haliotis rufescens]